LAGICLICISLIQAEVVDKIIARVGKDIILLSDLVKQINQMKSANMLPEGTRESDVLTQMIESKLIIQKAKDLNYTIDNNKIRTAAEKQVKEIRKRYDSDEQFYAALRQMKLTRYDITQYFEEKYTEQALTQQFYQKEIMVKVSVTDKEMLAFYLANQDTLAVKPLTYEIGMIIRQIHASPATEKEKLEAIKVIQDRLAKGEDFAELARSTSDCSSASQDGDLGFFAKGKMVKPFEDAAFGLKVGEVSDIVQTQFGYHLIKLEERRGKEIRVRHILKMTAPSEADTLAAREQLEQVRQAYLKDGNFAELATRWSEDEESAKQGGVIGDFSPEEYPELFAPVLNTIQVGGISEVLEHEGTLYLFAKLKEVPSRIYSFEELRSKIKELLTQQKQMKVYQKWIEQLKKEYYVELMI